MNHIKFEDFLKLNIQIGTITKAEKVDNADKLLKLTVNLGEEERQIMSGIAEYFEPEELNGNQVPVLANLEPKTFRGHESQGMILMADEDRKPILLQPKSTVEDGSIVR